MQGMIKKNICFENGDLNFKETIYILIAVFSESSWGLILLIRKMISGPTFCIWCSL